MKNKWLMCSLLLLLTIPFAAAGFMDTVGSVWQKILSVGSLNFLGVSGVLPLTRILIGVFVFTVVFATITVLGGQARNQTPFNLFNRAQAMVVAAVIAIITVIFLPAEVLLATGTGWATAVALLLIGGPIVGLGYLLVTYPEGEETKGTVLIKLVLCMLLFWILSAMKNAAVIG